VCAVVSTAGGQPPLTFADMRAHLVAQGVRSQAIPEQLEHVEVIPRNPAGKITKQALKDRFAAVART